MSAISGLLFTGNRLVHQSSFTKMLQGPGRQKFHRIETWVDDSIALGHHLLVTTPESRFEHLPLHDHTGDFVLTADARLDNRDELIALIGIETPSIKPITDAELILAAYKKWGERCPEYLVGDFSFGIWNQKLQRLFCGRDHYGLKPFYYYFELGKIFAFASEIKSLLSLEEVPCRLNVSRIATHIVTPLMDQEQTFYTGILRLPPAHSLTISLNAPLSIRQYWALDPDHELSLASDEAYAETFLGIFTEAVRCRLRSAYPVGLELSGGLDSSSITCSARRILEAQEGSRPLHTFSERYKPNSPANESYYQDKILEHNNFQAHSVNYEDIAPFKDLDLYLQVLDEPHIFPHIRSHWSMYEIAESNNVRVMLNGLDGDSVVSHGYGYVYELASQKKWLKLMREVQAYCKLHDQKNWPKTLGDLIWMYGLKPELKATLKPIILVYKRLCYGTPVPHSPLDAYPVSQELIKDFAIEERLREESGKSNIGRLFHYHSIYNNLFTHALECLNRYAAAQSIEPRSPFFDKRLLEFCLSLPGEQKFKAGRDRIVMRRAMQGILPEEIQWRRTKADLTGGLERALIQHNKEYIELALYSCGSTIKDYYDIGCLRQMYQRLQKGVPQGGDAYQLFCATYLSLWLQHTFS